MERKVWNNFEILDMLINDMFIPTFFLNDEVVNKHGFHWTKEDMRKV